MEIASVVEESIRLLESTLPATIAINKNIQDDIGNMTGDPTQIHQVVMNLCMNAFHAMKINGGELNISLAKVTLFTTKEIMDMRLPPGDYILLKVVDTGVGMSPSVMARIFEPYFTTKQVNEGSGLGMAVTMGIVKSHGGLIEVKSTFGHGTEFDVYFPVTSEKTDENEHEDSTLPQGNGEKIIVVDDKEFFLEIYKDGLINSGYNVIAFNNSIQALEILRNNKYKFDLIITDQSMPQMTGIQLIKEVRKFNNKIPIILCTGFSENLTNGNGSHHGATELLMKPVSFA